MTDDETSNLFGFEDPNLGLLDDGSTSGDIKTDPSSTTPDDGQFDSTGWGFPDQIPFTFDTTSTAPAVANSYSTSAWDSPPFGMQTSPSLGFDDLSPTATVPSTRNPSTGYLFGGPILQSQQAQRPTTKAKPSQTHAFLGANGRQQQQFPMLTPAAQEQLRNIAMPPHLQYNSPGSTSSPESLDKSALGRSKPGKPSTKKRKVSEPEDDDDDILEDDEGKPVKKTSHNMIEKRYRNNLNDKIAALRDAVPSLRIMSKSARGEDTTEDRQELHGLTPAHKLNKATVLSKATEYIRHLEKRHSRLQEENSTMRARIAAFEKLFMAGAMNGSIASFEQPPTPMQYAQCEMSADLSESAPNASPGSNGPPAGLIQVPEDMKRIIAAQMGSGQAYPIDEQQFRGPTVISQQQLQQQQQQEQGWGNPAPYFGKLMVGSLAGLMIMEAVREEETSNESPEGRGLFALPLHLVGRLLSSFDFNIMGYHFHTSLKLLLLFGTVMWVFIPTLFAPNEEKPKKPQFSSLQTSPSLASSIHVRRQAWLTAVQSVWIPRHSILLEALALLLKAAKLSVLNVIGSSGYQLLSGTTRDQEAARVRAWSIALDAQLSGGDVEINKSRLLITLLASGTLPDTPARLMLKALHIRVLLWDFSQHKWRLGASSAIASALATSRWNEARHLNRVLVETHQEGAVPYDDELPSHLACLVEQECDEVLNHELIQRAHNLAFNKETKHGVENPIDGMDCVVGDTAIGSPMDAVSAWFSIQVLHEALAATLSRDEDGPSARDARMELAAHTAPVGSVAQARAIVARAALSDQHRGSNIALAIQTVGIEKNSTESQPTQSTIVDANPSATSADIRLALRCATAVAHLRRCETRESDLQALDIIESINIPKDGMSLLGFTAVMDMVEKTLEHKHAAETYASTLERLAGGLRLWIGGAAADACGLGPTIRHNVAERCLSITKSLVGMDDGDTGYGTLSEGED